MIISVHTAPTGFTVVFSRKGKFPEIKVLQLEGHLALTLAAKEYGVFWVSLGKWFIRMMGIGFQTCTDSEDFVAHHQHHHQRGGAAGRSGAANEERVKREDCRYVKHDNLFSNWKVGLQLNLSIHSKV